MTTVAEEARGAGTAIAHGRLVWAALGIVYLVWGSTYLAIRVAVKTMPPLYSAGARFIGAALILGLVLRIRRGPGALRVDRKQQLGGAALVGLLLLLGGNGSVVIAEKTLPSGIAALLVATVPLWVVLIQAALRHKQPPMTLLGVAVGFGGLAVLVLPGGHGTSEHGFVRGVLIVCFASFSWAVGSVGAHRGLPLPRDPLVTTCYEMAFGGLGCVAAAAIRGERIHIGAVSGTGWVALAYLVVFGSLIAFTAYAWLLGHAPISLTATYAYVNPVVAVALGAIILGESVSWTVLLGGAIVVLGVALVITTERR